MTATRHNLPRSFEELAGLRARGLVRESTVAQGDNSGPIVQRQDLEAFAARWGLVLERRPGTDEPYLYTDLVSGSEASKRPAFLRMVADAKAGQFDVLLVRETSRFARNQWQAGTYLDELEAAGVVVAFTYDGHLSSDRAQKIPLAVKQVLDEDYRIKLGVNVQRGFRVKRFEEGRFSGSPPLGYVMEYSEVWNPAKRAHEAVDTGRLIPDVEPRERVGFGDTYSSAELVRLIGSLYASGRFGSRALAAHLNAEGYRNQHGRHIASGTIRHMLENPVYAGFLAWHPRKDKRRRGEAMELVVGPHESLWDEALWAQIAAVRARQWRGSAGGRITYAYPFRRLALCDRCGRRLYGEVHRGRKGQSVPYMACTTQRELHACDQKAVRSWELEDQVGDWLRTVPLPVDWRDDVERLMAVSSRPAARPAVDDVRIRGQLERLKDLFLMGDVDREDYVARRRALEASLAEGSLLAIRPPDLLAAAAGLLTDLGELWTRATTEERAELAQALFATVRVRDRDVVSVRPASDEYLPLWASAIAAQRVVGEAPPDGFEPPTPALGRPRSIH